MKTQLPVGMTEIERYLFDTQGCLIIEDILSDEELQRLLYAIPRTNEGKVAVDEKNDLPGVILEYHEPLYRGLINHPKLLPYLQDILTVPEANPWSQRFYLQHAYGMAFEAGKTGPWFHNGGTPYEPWSSYSVRDGRICCGLVGVVWALTKVQEGDGGFWYIPGSHQANFPLPRSIETYATIPSCVVQPALKAGSAIIFTEALTHGTRNWTAPYERIALFYKYLPGHMPLFGPHSQTLLETATDEQKKYLVPWHHE